MDYRRCMIDDLKQHTQRKCALVNLKENILGIESEIKAIKGADPSKVSVQGGGNKRDDKLIAKIVERDNLKRNIKIVYEAVKRIERGLATLDPVEKQVIDLFYLNRRAGHVEAVCELCKCESAEAYRKKDEALKKLTIAVYGVVEL